MKIRIGWQRIASASRRWKRTRSEFLRRQTCRAWPKRRGASCMCEETTETRGQRTETREQRPEIREQRVESREARLVISELRYDLCTYPCIPCDLANPKYFWEVCG